MTRVLVAYGSKRGATGEIAQWIGEVLRRDGLDVEIKDAAAVPDVSRYDAVVLGGALYAGRWHKDARRFARRHARSLHGRPVWLFSSGPLDHSAETADLPPVPQVVRAAAALDAREHKTFGGRLAADVQGFLAAAVAERSAGDYRDPEEVRAWADEIAAELTSLAESWSSPTATLRDRTAQPKQLKQPKQEES